MNNDSKATTDNYNIGSLLLLPTPSPTSKQDVSLRKRLSVGSVRHRVISDFIAIHFLAFAPLLHSFVNSQSQDLARLG